MFDDHEFEWGEHNTEHITRHGVQPWEAEDAVVDDGRARQGTRWSNWQDRGRSHVGRDRRARGASESDTACGYSSRCHRQREEDISEEKPMSEREKMVPLRDPSEVPENMSEAEEAEFWSTHEITEEYLEKSEPPPEGILPPARRSRSRPLGVRFDDEMIQRLKAVAEKKHKGYQTLLKEFVAERLYEEEKREGMLR